MVSLIQIWIYGQTAGYKITREAVRSTGISRIKNHELAGNLADHTLQFLISPHLEGLKTVFDTKAKIYLLYLLGAFEREDK